MSHAATAKLQMFDHFIGQFCDAYDRLAAAEAGDDDGEVEQQHEILACLVSLARTRNGGWACARCERLDHPFRPEKGTECPGCGGTEYYRTDRSSLSKEQQRLLSRGARP